MISSRKENFKACHITSFTRFCGGAKNGEMGFGIDSMQVFFMGFGMLYC